MKKITLFLIMFLLMIHIKASDNVWHWSKTIPDIDFVLVRKVVQDDSGHIYIIGEFDGTITFGSVELVSESVYSDTPDGFMAKYNKNGEFIWAVRIGNVNLTDLTGIGLDAAGDIYVTGSFTASFNDLDPDLNGPLNFQSTDGSYFSAPPLNFRTIFLAKYNHQGILQWVKTASGLPEGYRVAYAHAMAVSPEGDCYITGQFYGQIQFEGISLQAQGYGDSFLAKYSSSGEIAWAIKMNKSYHGRNRNIAIDNQGNVFVGGIFEEGYISFPDTVFYATQPADPKIKADIPKTENNRLFTREKDLSYQGILSGLNSGNDKFYFIPIVEDSFIAKYDQNGNYQWARHISGTQDEQIYGMKTDSQGNLIFAVNFMDNITIGDSTFNCAMGGIDISYYDLAIAKFDTDGNFMWAKTEGTNSAFVWSYDLHIDNNDRISIVGIYGESPTFSGQVTLPYAGISSAFVSIYENNGEFLNVFSVIGETGDTYQIIRSMVVDPVSRSYYLGGGFFGSIIIGNQVYYSQGYVDGFFAQVTPDLPPPVINQPGPENLTAEVVDQYNVSLSWDPLPLIPGSSVTEIFHGDQSVLGTTFTSEADIAVGYNLTQDVFLTEIKSYAAPTTNFTQNVSFFIYGDNNGLPDPSNILAGPYVVEIPGGFGTPLWIIVPIDTLFIPSGNVFHIVQAWNANDMNIGMAEGVPNTLNSVFLGGQWHSTASFEVTAGFIIRASGIIPEEVLGYNIYRNNKRVNPQYVENTIFEDHKVLYGDNSYHVTGIYPAGETQPSEQIIVQVNYYNHAGFDVFLTTNNNESAEGALVTLVNKSGNPEHRYSVTANPEEVAEFTKIWTGWGEEAYDIIVNHPHFETFKAENILITNQGGTYNIQLIEFIIPPFNLEIQTAYQQPRYALFSWNNSEIIDEGFENGVFPPNGWIKFNLDGGTGWEIISSGEAPAGWSGGTVEAAPNGGIKMAYVTYATGGQGTNDQWLVTPGVVVLEDFKLSFLLQYLPYFSNSVDIRISTSSQTDPQAFDILVDCLNFSPGSSMQWQQYSYNLTEFVPIGTKIYIAFREHIKNYPEATPIILLDNVYVGPEERKNILYSYELKNIEKLILDPSNNDLRNFQQKSLVGFNVFLNNAIVAEGISDPFYTFHDLAIGTFSAGVQAIYSTGASEIKTIDFMILPAVFFYVTDNSGQEIGDAVITFNNNNLDEGQYQIYNVLPGTYNYVVEKAGYQQVHGEVVVDETDVTIDIILEPDGVNTTSPETNSLNIYPVPARESLKIDSTEEIKILQLIDIHGKVIFESWVNSNSFIINTQGYKNGIYFLKIISGDIPQVQSVQIIN
jgi:hypothetical protein